MKTIQPMMAGLLVVSSSLAGAAPALAKQGDLAGVAGAVKGGVKQVLWRSKKAIGRNLSSGDRIFLGDRIRTGRAGRLQIMLMDKTTFTIGPNAAMVIDDFVYSPKTGAGRMTARILKGAFRYVSGSIAKKNPARVRIKLPVATVGIRGTTVVGFTNGRTATLVLTGFGSQNNTWQGPSRMTVTAAGKTVTVYRTSWGVIIRGPGLFPSPAQPFGPVQINAIVKQIMGDPRMRRGPNVTVPSSITAFTVQPPRGPFAGIFDMVRQQGQFGDLVTRPPQVPPGKDSGGSGCPSGYPYC